MYWPLDKEWYAGFIVAARGEVKGDLKGDLKGGQEGKELADPHHNLTSPHGPLPQSHTPVKSASGIQRVYQRLGSQP